LIYAKFFKCFELNLKKGSSFCDHGIGQLFEEPTTEESFIDLEVPNEFDNINTFGLINKVSQQEKGIFKHDIFVII